MSLTEFLNICSEKADTQKITNENSLVIFCYKNIQIFINSL
jgi:hypothetical protein